MLGESRLRTCMLTDQTLRGDKKTVRGAISKKILEVYRTRLAGIIATSTTIIAIGINKNQQIEHRYYSTGLFMVCQNMLTRLSCRSNYMYLCTQVLFYL